MRITAAGNVGIGTTSPSQKLHVDGHTLISAEKYYYVAGGGAGVGSDASGNLILRQNSANLMTTSGSNATFAGSVTSSNFIISDGTDNYIQFDLNGKNSHFTNQSKSFIFSGQGASGDYLAGTLNFQSRSSVDRDINFITGATPAKRLTISGSGNVGIGTSSPVNKIQANYSPVAIASLTANTGTASTNWNRNAFLMGTGASASNALAFGVSGTANDRKAWIQSGHPDTAASSLGIISLNPLGGNVGIGTTSPSSALDVRGVIESSTGTIRTVLSYTGSGGVTGTLTNHPYILYANNAERMRIDASGNVGIGTTNPGYKLDVSGTAAFGNGTGQLSVGSDGTSPFIETTGTNDLRFITGGADQMVIDSAGNVGIGVASPPAGTRLDVAGDTNIQGTLTAVIKSFTIDHPTKEGKKLQYGVLEGPEHSVYVRGRLTNENTIVLPDHWYGLVHEDTITVNLTCIGRTQDLWVQEVNAYTITVGSEQENINCFYTVFAERKDVDKLIVEFDKV